MKFGKLNVSAGTNSKLGKHIYSINLPAGKTCNPDAPCRKICYALKGRYVFENVRAPREENLLLWKLDPAAYEEGCNMAADKVDWLRFHDSGDIPDPAYLEMMCRVAENHDSCHFLAFTKQYSFVNDFLRNGGIIPENLNIVFSVWDGWECPNPFNFPTAHVRLKAGNVFKIPECAHKCPKFCGACVYSEKSCWSLQHGESVVFDQH